VTYFQINKEHFSHVNYVRYSNQGTLSAKLYWRLVQCSPYRYYKKINTISPKTNRYPLLRLFCASLWSKNLSHCVSSHDKAFSILPCTPHKHSSSTFILLCFLLYIYVSSYCTLHPVSSFRRFLYSWISGRNFKTIANIYIFKFIKCYLDVFVQKSCCSTLPIPSLKQGSCSLHVETRSKIEDLEHRYGDVVIEYKEK
jgi:hypothetical protein